MARHHKGKARKHGGASKTSAASNPLTPPNYVTKAAGFATGGAVGAVQETEGKAQHARGGRAKRARGGALLMPKRAPMAPIAGVAAIKRLDRPGRKRGGAVGADSAPLTTANHLSEDSESEEP